jgi:hypothetical protein
LILFSPIAFGISEEAKEILPGSFKLLYEHGIGFFSKSDLISTEGELNKLFLLNAFILGDTIALDCLSNMGLTVLIGFTSDSRELFVSCVKI